jgi:hypothetical protein
VCVLAVPLAGCGSGTDGSADAGAGNGRGTSTVRAVRATAVSVDAFLSRVEAGLQDSPSAHLRMTVTGAVQATATGDVSFSATDLRLRTSVRAPMLGTDPATVIVVGDTAYVAVPGFTPPGKYVRIERGARGMRPGAGSSPAALLAALRAAVVRVDDLGAERVAGTATEHYRLHLAPGKAFHRVGAPLGRGGGPGPMPGVHSGPPSMMGPPGTDPGMPGPGMMGPGMMGRLPRTLVADVWLDGQDRVRQVQAELRGTKVDVDLTGWGQHVDVQPPAPGDVVPAPLER